MEEQADEVRKRRKLSPEDRLQVYREYVAAKAGKQGEVGDLLRRWELHSSDVSRLVRAVETGVLEQLRERKSRRPRVTPEEIEALQVEKTQLEKTIVAQAAEIVILKKKTALALTGDLAGKHLTETQRAGLVELIEELQRDHGLTAVAGCAAVRLDYRRYRRWLRCHAKTERYGGGKPGPRNAPHALLATERTAIQALRGAEKYQDMSIRQVAVAASEAGEVEASSSSFQRVWAAQDPGLRRKAVDRPKPGKPEVTAERPNQVWSWDMTFIRLGCWFVYLFAIIDVHSRKIVGWHLSWHATVEAMKVAWDQALANEGLIGCRDAPQLPKALSDRGVQMKCKLALKFFLDLGILQFFARCHTPTDNAWIESWFNLFKNSWLRFKDYTTFSELLAVVAGFVEFYNRKRVHGSIGMVTPEQMHTGQAPAILAQRRARRQAARAKRFRLNREAAAAETDELIAA